MEIANAMLAEGVLRGTVFLQLLNKPKLKGNTEMNLLALFNKVFGSPAGESPKEVLKASEEMVSYEVVYEPYVKDAHGEWMSPETILKASENFNKNLEAGVIQPNLFHLTNTDLFEIEKTWVQEELDVVVEQTGEVIKAGTWISKIRYKDPDLWELKKANIIQGVSIYGLGYKNTDTGEITDVFFDPIETEIGEG